MKTYIVYARRTINYNIEIEARSEEEAYEKAEQMPFDEFEEQDEYYSEPEFDFYDCEEAYDDGEEDDEE